MDSGARRIVPIILGLIIIAVAVAAAVSIGQEFFGGDSQPEEVNQGKRSLLMTSEDRSVRMTVRGPIVADEEHHSYMILISPTGRTMTTYNGYLKKQVDTKVLTNNIPAYEEFVHALDLAGMMDAPELTGDANDTRGLCANGQITTFETLRGSTVIKTLWSTNCDGIEGSLNVSVGRLRTLFRSQVPDSLDMVSKIGIQ